MAYLLATTALACGAYAEAPTDLLLFGNPASEQQHDLTADHSVAIKGALGQSARQFIPLETSDPHTNWRGGEAHFRLKVKGDRQNYLSVRLWGGDNSPSRATLFCDGKQVGYRMLGDIDILEQGTLGKPLPGHFHYMTGPLPLALTKGKNQISCDLRSSGPVWRYGGNFERFQKAMTEPTRGFYALIVHDDKMVTFDGNDGSVGIPPPHPAESDAVLDEVKERVNREVRKMWDIKRPPNQLDIWFLAKTYNTAWTAGYHNMRNLKLIVEGIDGLYANFAANPKFIVNDKGTPNPDWFGAGLVGQALKITAPDLAFALDSEIPTGGGKVTRRQALERMFYVARQWNTYNRRLYTNQSMIKDLYGIWYDNEGLIAIGSKYALPRTELMPFFYESTGLAPWTGSRTKDGKPTYASSEADAKFSVPKNYRLVTDKGLTKELGYVGGYGEILDWVASIFEATKTSETPDGDPRIREQMIKLARARTIFRHPAADNDGFATMRLETGIGWRDVHFPGDEVYAQRPSWDASPLQVALLSRDPHLLGYVQQQLAENQFFPAVAHMLETNTMRATIGMIDVIDEYKTLRSLSVQPYKLPMSRGQPDFVFSDEEDGVVAVKHGGDILYASLYWRAHYAISNLARVHYVTPETDRIATVALDREDFQPAGITYTRPDNPTFSGNAPRIKYPDEGNVWTAGEPRPVAKLPDGVVYSPTEHNPFAGRADYYELRYGPYFIAMNAGTAKPVAVTLPATPKRIDLTAGKPIAAGETVYTLAPRTTLVLYLGDTAR